MKKQMDGWMDVPVVLQWVSKGFIGKGKFLLLMESPWQGEGLLYLRKKPFQKLLGMISILQSLLGGGIIGWWIHPSAIHWLILKLSVVHHNETI